MMINLEHIQKCFGEKVALKDINLQVKEGEILGLLGPSGAGKTTLLKIITGQLKVDSGKSRVLGKISKDLTDKEYSQMGMVLDNCGLYTRLSVYQNLLLFIRLYHLPKIRIDEVLEQVGLEEAKNVVIQKLSKGMIQRLVLARAILNRPKLLFLDEPTSGLDPTTAKMIHELILKLREEGATIFLTTHNMEEATKLCDQVALLFEGEIIEYGSPKAICLKHNLENKITISLKSGELVDIEHSPRAGEEIAKYFVKDEVVAIHSAEPNLENVFIKLTGKELGV